MINQLESEKEIIIPQFPVRLEGSFWGITTFFNPARYRNKARNYYEFRKASKKQGLNLICVELAFGEEPFELTKGDADILVQIRSNSVMWQKERLLNVGLKHLPKDCDKVAWIDCDLIFYNDDWIRKASNLLEKYIAVQLFSFIFYPAKGKEDSDNFHFGIAYGFAMVRHFLFNEYYKKGFPGLPGGAWACRREALEKCGFFDSCIFGSNDSIMAYAIHGIDKISDFDILSKQLTLQQSIWHKKASEVFNGSLFYLDGVLEHLWHGDLGNRDYVQREKIGKMYNFDPASDIKLNENGCFEWASSKEEMHKSLFEYFLKRKEE